MPGATGCRVCFNEVGQDGVGTWACTACDKDCCVRCFANWVSAQLGAGAGVTCPFCPAPITQQDVDAHCTPVVAARFTYFKARREHEQDTRALWCATDGCPALLQRRVDRSAGDVHCTQCERSTCARCGGASHTGHCSRPRLGAVAMARSAIWRRTHARRCPRCKVWIQKDGGCSEMECVMCGTSFCYRCGTQYFGVGLAGGTVDGCRCMRVRRASLRAARTAAVVVSMPLLVAATTIGAPAAALLYAVSSRERRAKADRAFEQFFGTSSNFSFNGDLPPPMNPQVQARLHAIDPEGEHTEALVRRARRSDDYEWARLGGRFTEAILDYEFDHFSDSELLHRHRVLL